jgi:hypothetical protein
MAEKVKLSKDGNSIDFVQGESVPTSLKKFRQSPEIEGFYRFIFENDLQKETFDILDRLVNQRRLKKQTAKKELQQANAAALALEKKSVAAESSAKNTKKPAPAPLHKSAKK